MVSRRRNYSEAEAAPAQQQPAETKKKAKDGKEDKGKEEPGLLHRLRNCWEFANLMQYISMFGKVMKIDEDFGIEVSSVSALGARDLSYCAELVRIQGIAEQMADGLPLCKMTGSGKRMPQAYAVRETPGNRPLSSEMDFVASGSYVRCPPGIHVQFGNGRMKGY